MKGKNTLRDKPFRYGGILKDYSKEIHEITGCEYKCWTCQYRHSDAGGCDYCIHTGKERGCDVKVCDKAVEGPRLTRK